MNANAVWLALLLLGISSPSLAQLPEKTHVCRVTTSTGVALKERAFGMDYMVKAADPVRAKERALEAANKDHNGTASNAQCWAKP